MAAAFTRARFEEGRFVCQEVGGRLGLELRLTWLGGTRVLERVEERRADLLTYRPAIRPADVPPLVWRAARWSAGKGAAA